jgi:hypothetical protein
LVSSVTATIQGYLGFSAVASTAFGSIATDKIVNNIPYVAPGTAFNLIFFVVASNTNICGGDANVLVANCPGATGTGLTVVTPARILMKVIVNSGVFSFASVSSGIKIGGSLFTPVPVAAAPVLTCRTGISNSLTSCIGWGETSFSGRINTGVIVTASGNDNAYAHFSFTCVDTVPFVLTAITAAASADVTANPKLKFGDKVGGTSGTAVTSATAGTATSTTDNIVAKLKSPCHTIAERATTDGVSVTLQPLFWIPSVSFVSGKYKGGLTANDMTMDFLICFRADTTNT